MVEELKGFRTLERDGRKEDIELIVTPSTKPKCISQEEGKVRGRKTKVQRIVNTCSPAGSIPEHVIPLPFPSLQ